VYSVCYTATGSVSKNTEIPLPAGTPVLSSLVRARQGATKLSIVSWAEPLDLSSDEIALKTDGTAFALGNDLAESNTVVILANPEAEGRQEIVTIVPDATTAGDDIALPGGYPEIARVTFAYLIQTAHQHTLDLTAEAVTAAIGISGSAGHLQSGAAGPTQSGKVTHTGEGIEDLIMPVAPTLVDSRTVKLDLDTTAGDLLILGYIPVGALLGL